LAEKFGANCQIRLDDDVDLVVFVNRQMLSFYSKFFEIMFTSDFAEKEAAEIHLPKVSSKDLLAFLRCLYLPSDPITIDNIIAVFKLADQFECDALLGASEHFLTVSPQVKHRESQECVEIAERRHFHHLVKTLIQGATTDMIRIFLQPGWCDKRNEITRHLILQEASERLAEQ